MNISLGEDGKKMSHKMFVKAVGRHFNHFHEDVREAEIEKCYTELTGRKIVHSGKHGKKSQDDSHRKNSS